MLILQRPSKIAHCPWDFFFSFRRYYITSSISLIIRDMVELVFFPPGLTFVGDMPIEIHSFLLDFPL